MTFAEQLKSQLDIVEVIGHYIPLKRRGSSVNVVGLCPFHTEKTPSFSVHRTHQFYKCFSCDAKGDLINFVMQMESVDFVEALKILSDRYGIPMPARRDLSPGEQLREALMEMHEIATTLFQDNLASPRGAEARQYIEERGLTTSTVREFRLGLALDDGRQLASRLAKFGAELLQESGLVSRNEGSAFYDRFRNRLMFPIHSESGKVIGFGGRVLSKEAQPKYLNSPETKLYKKSSVLYNLHRAKTQARKQERMILVEGYMDAIGLAQAGVSNVVASCGTSLTTDQVRAIKRQIAHADSSATQVIVNFDPDPGGTRGAERSIHLLLAEGLRVRILNLPNDEDPDEYVQAQGVERYLQLANQAPPYFFWLIDRVKDRFDVTTPEGRTSALHALWPVLQKVHDRVERSGLMEEMAQRLQIDIQLLRDQLRQDAPAQSTWKRVVELSSSIPPNERLLLSCLLQSEDARAAVLHYFERSGLPQALELKSVFKAMLDLHALETPFSLSSLLEQLEPREQKIVTELSFHQSDGQADGATAQALHCLQALESKSQEEKRTAIKRQIRDAESRGDLQAALRLADELKAIGGQGPRARQIP